LILGLISFTIISINVMISFSMSLMALITLFKRRKERITSVNFFLNKYCEMSYNLEF
jgi:hypothetical protein